MSQRPIMRPLRVPKRPSIVATALVFLGLDAVFSVIFVLLFLTPAPLKDLAVMTAIMMVLNGIWLGVVLSWKSIWERITRKRIARKRRRYGLDG